MACGHTSMGNVGARACLPGMKQNQLPAGAFVLVKDVALETMPTARKIYQQNLHLERSSMAAAAAAKNAAITRHCSSSFCGGGAGALCPSLR